MSYDPTARRLAREGKAELERLRQEVRELREILESRRKSPGEDAKSRQKPSGKEHDGLL